MGVPVRGLVVVVVVLAAGAALLVVVKDFEVAPVLELAHAVGQARAVLAQRRSDVELVAQPRHQLADIAVGGSVVAAGTVAVAVVAGTENVCTPKYERETVLY